LKESIHKKKLKKFLKIIKVKQNYLVRETLITNIVCKLKKKNSKPNVRNLPMQIVKR